MNGPAAGQPRHVPVLPAEVLHYLSPAPGQLVVDATVGVGGHSLLIASHLGPEGRLLALDQDPAMLEIARARLHGLPITFVPSNFDQLRQVLDEQGIDRVDAVLADLGVCSDQLNE
ncbi:MAG: 16S rRNA (cytosine1402-N4)-methyltransferase, partial [bacterium]